MPLGENAALFYLFIYLFIYLIYFGCVGSSHGLSLVAASRGYSSLQRAGFSLQWLLLSWCTGLVAPRHVGYSRPRA